MYFLLVQYLQSRSHDLLANVRRVKFYMYRLLFLWEEWLLVLEGLIAGIVIVNAGAAASMLSGPIWP